MKNLIPLPASIIPRNGKYTLHPQVAICVPRGLEEIRLIGQFLAECLRPACGYDLPVVYAGKHSAGGISLTTEDVNPELGPEGYELTVEPGGILLRALQPAGLFRGVQTIRQLLPPAIEARANQPGPWQMDCGIIQDFPRFPWRGAMLDVARHFFSAA